MKDLLKRLSEEQRALKMARKTGSYEFVAAQWGGWDFAKVPEKVRTSWEAASKVRENALLITAALNLYHEKRGSSYRHNVPDLLKVQYGKLIVKLNNQVGTV